MSASVVEHCLLTGIFVLEISSLPRQFLHKSKCFLFVVGEGQFEEHPLSLQVVGVEEFVGVGEVSDE